MVKSKSKKQETAVLKSLVRLESRLNNRLAQPMKQSKSSKKKNNRNRGGSISAIPLDREVASSWMDPWSYSACVPDGSSGTGCFSVKQTFTVKTGTGTACCFLLNPQYNGMYYQDSGSANATPTITGNWGQAAETTVISSLFGKYRPVSAGLRCSFNGNTLNDQGEILVAQFAGGVTPASNTGATISAVAAQSQYYKIFSLRQGCKICWVPQDIDDTMQFQTVNSSNVAVSTTLPAPWLGVFVYDAATASGCLVIELIVNFEGQYANQTLLTAGMNGAQRPAVPGWYEKAKNMTKNWEFITPVLSQIANAAFRNVGPILGNSLANGLASTIMYDSSRPRRFPSIGYY